MPIRTACPATQCRTALTIPDALRTQPIRCPRCGLTFRLSEPQQPAETQTFSPSPSPSSISTRDVSPPKHSSQQTPPLKSDPYTTVEPTAPPRSTSVRGKIARFEIRKWLGEGAFGKVYEAYDGQLDRAVAIKVAKLGGGDSAQRVKRFLREAKAAAGLRHPHIVPVFEFGQQEDQFYIVSAFIQGRTLASDLRAAKGPMDPARAGRIVRQLAEALAYAHSMGIVHRDVKPANIMLDGRDEPMLMDFGLATRQDEAEKLTHEGAVLGTPMYMAPEQARGHEGAALPASDQYSLGVVLYEIIAGRTPFQGTPELVMFHHTQTDPPRPRSFRRSIPRDLETICLKCLDKSPEKRYADGAALAEDLRRWQAGEPVLARRAGPVDRLVKWVRRSPAVASLTLATLLVFAVGAIVSLYYAGEASRNAATAKTKADEAIIAQKKADKEKDDANDARFQAQLDRGKAVEQQQKAEAATREKDKLLKRSQHLSYHAQFADSFNAFQNNDLTSCRELLNETQVELRGPEYRYLANRLNVKGRGIRDFGLVHGLALSGDGKRLYITGANGAESVDVATGATIQSLPNEKAPVTCLALSGQRLCSGCEGEDPTINLWDLETGKVAITLPGHTEGTTSLAISSDGKWLFSSGRFEDSAIKAWNLKTGKEAFVLKGHEHAANCLIVSADGRLLVSGSQDGKIKIWDLVARKLAATLSGHQGDVKSLALTRDGKLLYSGSDDRTIKTWDLTTNEETAQWSAENDAVSRQPRAAKPGGFGAVFGDSGGVNNLALTADEKQLISSCGDTIKVWDLASGKGTLSLRGHSDGVTSLALSPDGKTLYSASWDGTVKSWAMDLAAAGDSLVPPMVATAVTFSNDGKSLYVGLEDKSIKRLDRKGALATMPDHTQAVSQISFSADGKRLVAASWTNERAVKIWDAITQEPVAVLPTAMSGPRAAALSRDGRRLYVATETFVQAWDLDRGASPFRLDYEGTQVLCLALAPDGKSLYAGCSDGPIRIWDVETKKEMPPLVGHVNRVTCLAFSADGDKLFSGSEDLTIKIWDRTAAEPQAQPVTLFAHKNDVTSLAVSKDSRRVISGSADRTIKIWDLESGKELLMLRGHADGVAEVVLSPDETVLISRGRDGTLKRWDLTPPVEPLILAGHNGGVAQMWPSLDDKHLVSAGNTDKSIRVWELQSRTEICATPSPNAIHGMVVTNDRFFAFAFDNPAVKAWDLRTGKPSFELNGHPRGATYLALSPDGGRIFVGCGDGAIKIWDAKSGDPIRTLPGHSNITFCLVLSADGTKLYSGGDDPHIKVWDIASGETIATIPARKEGVRCLALSPDGKWLCSSADQSMTIQVTDLETGARIFNLNGHKEALDRLQVSADSKLLFSLDLDRRLKIWSLETGKEVRLSRGEPARFDCPTISHDGRRFLTGTAGNTIQVWDLDAMGVSSAKEPGIK